MNAAELFIACLENEGVEYIFGIPGEENLHVMDALRDSSIKFITVRHEQGAAFMADVYGRLTGRAGVCLATLGLGATSLITGFADANMDRAPIVAIAGQGSTERMHKENHQMLDLVNLFKPISKYSTEILQPEIVPEVVRKAFKDAQAEKTGGAFISFPENIAAAEVMQQSSPLKVQSSEPPYPAPNKIRQAVEVIYSARFPIVMAGNGVIRSAASRALIDFVEKLNIPVVHTFMAKGCVPFSHSLSIGTVGLQVHDYFGCGFDRTDVVICVGYDMVEYHPKLWNPQADKKIIHIDQTCAEIDTHYQLEVEVLGELSKSLELLAEQAVPKGTFYTGSLREVIKEELDDYNDDNSFPLKPQRILYDTRHVLADDDILLSDVGAHKMWIARLYCCELPNTCIISNGFASMGIALAGALAAKLAYPQKRVLAITGDAGFLMNSQEIETALRHNLAFVVMIWHDKEYGLIKWHQQPRFRRSGNISFNNPDFVKYAESFGAIGYHIDSADELIPTLELAFSQNTVVIVDVLVDRRENMKLTEKLG